VLAAAALAACAAGPRDCTLVDCEGSVVIRVATALIAGESAPTLRVCFDDQCQDRAVDPVGRLVRFGGRADHPGAPPLPELDPDRDHTVSATYVGADGTETSVGPVQLDRFEPNGHVCGPTCFGADLQLG
jgi:hypothetical protein